MTERGDILIPVTNGILTENFEVEELSSRTFFLDIENNRVIGFTDGREAMIQAIYLILQTERFQHIIFSWDYGVEFVDLYGREFEYVIPEVERRIKEALLQDTRITSVEDFNFQAQRSRLLVTFTAVTIFGDIPIESAVNV